MTTPRLYGQAPQPRLYNFNRPIYDPTGRTGTGARRSTQPLRPVYTVSPGVVGDEQTEQAPAPQPTQPPQRLYMQGKPDAATSPAGSTQQRVYQPNSVVQANDDLQRLLTTPAEDANGRFHSGLNVAATAAGETARSTQSIGQTVGAAAGGLLAGIFRPSTDERLYRPYQIQQAAARVQAAAAADKEQREAQESEAERNLKEAQTRYYNWRPTDAQNKADAQALARTQSALRSELKQRLQNPRPFDPTDAYDSDLQQRASAAGVGYDPRGFGDYHNPFTLEILDPTDPSGTRKTRTRYNRTTQEFEPVTVDDKPVTTGYVQPVDPKTGMTSAQEHTDADRDAARANTERHQRVVETQGATRINQGQQRIDRMGQVTPAQTNGRLMRGAAIQQKVDDANGRADHPPTVDQQGNPLSDQARSAYAARWRAKARPFARQLQTG